MDASQEFRNNFRVFAREVSLYVNHEGGLIASQGHNFATRHVYEHFLFCPSGSVLDARGCGAWQVLFELAGGSQWPILVDSWVHGSLATDSQEVVLPLLKTNTTTTTITTTLYSFDWRRSVSTDKQDIDNTKCHNSLFNALVNKNERTLCNDN